MRRMRGDRATHGTASGSVDSLQDDSNRICIDNMKRFYQICVREQGNCSEQFTEVPRHPAIGRTSELGQSEDWRLPVRDFPTFGQIVFTGDSLIVVHALPAYHSRSVTARSVSGRALNPASHRLMGNGIDLNVPFDRRSTLGNFAPVESKTGNFGTLYGQRERNRMAAELWVLHAQSCCCLVKLCRTEVLKTFACLVAWFGLSQAPMGKPLTVPNK